MKVLLLVVACMLAGCASVYSEPEPIPANRLYWPQHVDRAVHHNGNVYIIRGR